MAQSSPHVLGRVWNTRFDAGLLQNLFLLLQLGGTFSSLLLLIRTTANARKLGGREFHAFSLATQSAESRLETARAFAVMAIGKKQLCMSGCNLTHPLSSAFDGAFFVSDVWIPA